LIADPEGEGRRWEEVSVFEHKEMIPMRSLLALAAQTVAACLRERVERAPAEVQELLGKLGKVQAEIQLYM